MKGDRGRQKQNMTSEQSGFLRSILDRFGGRFQANQPENELIDYVVNTIEPK
ncbi:MAG: hypothetical protein GQ542_04920 [Desulforhopalus sp.]|nr:hypothetical protein [Desulforhopalus sp.]